jgi:hypothetical protein
MRMLVGNIKLVSKDNDLALLQVAEEMRPAAESAEQDLCNLLSAAWGQPIRVDLLPLPEEGGSGVGPARQTNAPTTTTASSPKPLPEGGVGVGSAPPPTTQGRTPPATPHSTSDITSHPLIKQAIDLFGAKVVGVQPRRKQAE